MKKIAIIGLMSLCAAGAYAQGTLLFSDYQSEGYSSQIFSPNTAAPTVEVYGNTAANSPAGTQTYPNSVPIGGSTGTGLNYAYGNQFTVQMYWTPNTYVASHLTAGSTFLPAIMATIETPQAAFSSFNGTSDVGQGNGNPSPSYVGTMSDGTLSQPAGFFQVNNPPTTDNGLFGDTQTQDDFNNLGAQDTAATVAVACWYNAGGTINSLAAASSAHVPYGISLPFTMSSLGEDSADETLFQGQQEPGNLTPAMNKLTSFSLVSTVPEPSMIALGVMGVCAFLARRKK